MDEKITKPNLSSLRIDRSLDQVSRRRASGNRTMWLWLVSALLALAVAFVLFRVYGSGTYQVETATVQHLNPAGARSLLTATGYVVAQRMAAVASKGTGRLAVLNVEEGDRVKKGDILAQIEADDVQASLRVARAAVVQAEAELERAKAIAKEADLNFGRSRRLLADSLISQADFDNAEAVRNSAVASVDAAAAAVKSARAGLEYARVQVEYTRIRAPFDGTVLTKNADVGEVVAPLASSASSKGAVLTLADMSSLEVEADVSESNIQRIRPGQPCVITLDALPAEPYRGHVKKIVPTADRAKATVMTKVTFDHLDRRVLPEMSAKVSFLPAAADTGVIDVRSVLSVPAAAVVQRDKATVVFVVHDNRVRRAAVDVGRTFSGAVEIRAGLQSGEVVVLHPPDGMNDGDRVELKP